MIGWMVEKNTSCGVRRMRRRLRRAIVRPSVSAAPRGRVATTGAAAGDETLAVVVLMRCSSHGLGGRPGDPRCAATSASSSAVLL